MPRILDSNFKYVSATSQDVQSTWRRFGFVKTTQAERNARIRRQTRAAPQMSKAARPELEIPFPEHSSAVAAPNVRELKRRAK